jgi:putative ABC transport system permease protein
VAETALALVLAIGATLLIRTFFYLRDVAPGFRVDTLLTARVTPPTNKFASREQCIRHWTELMARIRSIPGVQSATFAQNLPMTGENSVGKWPVEGHSFASPNDIPAMWIRNTDTEYFRTMQMALRAGRFFNERDNMAGPKVVLVNESFARRFWPNGDAIGKHVGGGDAPLHEIIGVVGDVRVEDSTKAAPPEMFFHYLQVPPARIALAIRADPRVYPNIMALGPAVDRAVTGLDKTQRVTHVAEMRRLISDRIASKRLSAQLIAAFAGLALVLAAFGIYGVLSFSVAQRTHEIGVRVALGARRSEVVRLVAGEAAGLALTGIAAGAGAAFALMRVIRTLVYGVSPSDPWLYAGAAAALFAIAMLAAMLPAWRATRVDPLTALRQE